MTLTKEEVFRRLASAAFGKSLVSNMYRGLVAEVLVGSTLSPEWKWCSADWAGWDFEHVDRTKLEVKQSAALQTWSREGRVTNCTFGIAAAKGYFCGDVWTREPGRQASIYVFAHHPGTDLATTDHRDPQQWQFFVLPASELPKLSLSIGLKTLTALSSRVWNSIDEHRKSPCQIEQLAEAVEALRIGLSNPRDTTALKSDPKD